MVLAQDLSPSETAGLDPNRVLGFATEAGGRASHTAIVAAALEIPAVVGLGKFLDIARTAGRRSLTATRVWSSSTRIRQPRLVIARPPLSGRHAFRSLAAGQPASRDTRFHQDPALGQHRVHRGDRCLRETGRRGVGLIRTEFLFLNAQIPPSEEQQFQAYAAVTRSLRGRPIVIRTLDLGADKLQRYRESAYLEPNPCSGAAQPATVASRPGVVQTPVAGDSASQQSGRRPDSFSSSDHTR